MQFILISLLAASCSAFCVQPGTGPGSACSGTQPVASCTGLSQGQCLHSYKWDSTGLSYPCLWNGACSASTSYCIPNCVASVYTTSCPSRTSANCAAAYTSIPGLSCVSNCLLNTTSNQCYYGFVASLCVPV